MESKTLEQRQVINPIEITPIEGETFALQQVSTLQSMASLIEREVGPEDGTVEQFQKQLNYALLYVEQIKKAAAETREYTSEKAKFYSRAGAGMEVLIDYISSQIEALTKKDTLESFAPGAMETLSGKKLKVEKDFLVNVAN